MFYFQCGWIAPETLFAPIFLVGSTPGPSTPIIQSSEDSSSSGTSTSPLRATRLLPFIDLPKGPEITEWGQWGWKVPRAIWSSYGFIFNRLPSFGVLSVFANPLCNIWDPSFIAPGSHLCFVRGGNELGIVPSTVIDLQKLGIATPTTPQSAAPNPLLRLMAGTFTPGLRILPGHCVQQMKAATAIATATPSKTHSRVWSWCSWSWAWKSWGRRFARIMSHSTWLQSGKVYHHASPTFGGLTGAPILDIPG